MKSAAIDKQDNLKGPIRRDGRVIVSYPKSGRTWLGFALAQHNISVSLSHAGSSTGWRDIGRPFSRIHPLLSDLPLVFLYRNPIDTAVSMFYQVHRRDLRRGSGRWLRMYVPLKFRSALPPEEINAFVSHPIYGIENVCAYNRAWLDHISARSDCLILTYEKMRTNPEAGFQNLLDFFGEHHVTGDDLAASSTFEKMKAVEQQGDSLGYLRQPSKNDPSSAKVRRGKVEGYRDELQPGTVEFCQKIVSTYGF